MHSFPNFGMRRQLAFCLVAFGGCAAALPVPLAAANEQPPKAIQSDVRSPTDKLIPADYIRTDFTVEDGLPNNIVYTLVETENGLLWVGTQSGLASFDGREFRSISLQTEGAPAQGTVHSLLESSTGDLWVATDAGVVRIPKAALDQFSPSLLTFYQVGPAPTEAESLLQTRDGTLWAGTNHGLYQEHSGKFVEVISSGVLDMNKLAPQAVPAQITESKGTNLARELFTSNFWMSSLAILKYIPRSFRVKQVDGMAFFTDAKHEEFRNRVLRITPTNPRQWGTMNVSQMLYHLNLACGRALGFYKLPDESYFLSRTLFRWILIGWFPEQPVGLRLPKGFKIPHAAEFDFDFEKQQLLKIVHAAWHARSPNDWGPHPIFGKMTLAKWGKLFQIHIDYHLKQFAA